MSPKPCVSYTIGFDVHLITSSSLMIVTKVHLQQLINYVLKLCKIIARLLRDFSRLTILQKTKRDDKTRKIGIDILCFGMWFYFRIHYQVIYFFADDRCIRSNKHLNQTGLLHSSLHIHYFLKVLQFCNGTLKIRPW